MRRIIHTGQALVDAVIDVPALPERGGNVVAESAVRYPAGAVNVLVAAARSGASGVHAGAHGVGPNGDLVRAALEREGIALTSAPIAQRDTGVCTVLVEPSGERTFVTAQGAERDLTPQMLEAAHPAPGDLVCVSGYTLQGRTCAPLLEWLERAHQAVVVVLDPGAPFAGLDPQVRSRMLAVTQVYTANAQEAAQLAGTSGAPALERIAELLPAEAVIIVRDGPRGCVLSQGGRHQAVAGYPQKPLDTNGAGDVHTGVLVAARAAGADWVVAGRRANAAAAVKVTRRGPASAPTAEQIDDFLSQQGTGSAAVPGRVHEARP